MKYFKISDFEVTTTGLPNKMNSEDAADCEWFIENILDKIREKYGRPIYVNSGFRNESVNKRVNGAANSDHRSVGKIFAADITAGNKVDNKKLFDIIKKMQVEGTIAFKQLINEYGYKWVHISSHLFDNYSKNKNQILNIGA